MATTPPSSWIMLCHGVNLRDDHDTIYFESETQRYNYMLDHAIIVNPAGGDNESKRKLQAQMFRNIDGRDNALRVNVDYQTLIDCDYMIMCPVANSQTGKKHYCFVDRVEYVSEGITLVEFHEDCIQTWIDDVHFGKSKVKRMHTHADVTFAVTTKTPDFFAGELNMMLRKEIRSAHDVGYDASKCITIDASTEPEYIVLITSTLLYPDKRVAIDDEAFFGCKAEKVFNWDSTWPTYTRNISGRPDPFYYYIAKKTDISAAFAVLALANSIVSGKTKDCFVSLTMLPEICLPSGLITVMNSTYSGKAIVLVTNLQEKQNIDISPDLPTTWWHFTDWATVYFPDGAEFRYSEVNWSIPFSTIKSALFEGYTPKNKKLYNSPYWFMRIKDNAGGYFELQPQDLKHLWNSGDTQDEEHMRFGGTIYGFMNPQSIVTLFPKYNGASERETSYKLTLPSGGDIPVLSEQFSQWLNQAKLTVPMTMLSAIPSAIASKGLSLIPTLAGAAASQMAEGYAAAQAGTSPIMSGTTFADVTSRALNDAHFTVEIWSISYQDAQIVDSYLSQFGYVQNRIMTPEDTRNFYTMNNRPYWCYVELEDAHPLGSIPGYAQTAIANKFNGGLRMWKRNTEGHEDFMEYNNDNSPLPIPS